MAPELLEHTHLGRFGELFSWLLALSILVDLVLVALGEVLKRLGWSITPVTGARLIVHTVSALLSLALALNPLLLLGLGWQSRWYLALKLVLLTLLTLFFWHQARKELRRLSGQSQSR